MLALLPWNNFCNTLSRKKIYCILPCRNILFLSEHSQQWKFLLNCGLYSKIIDTMHKWMLNLSILAQIVWIDQNVILFPSNYQFLKLYWVPREISLAEHTQYWKIMSCAHKCLTQFPYKNLEFKLTLWWSMWTCKHHSKQAVESLTCSLSWCLSAQFPCSCHFSSGWFD